LETNLFSIKNKIFSEFVRNVALLCVICADQKQCRLCAKMGQSDWRWS